MLGSEMPMTQEILGVEAGPDVRRLFVLPLEGNGFRCRTAATGPEALRAARSRPPHLVVLDLLLPEMDGLEVCRRLRADPATERIPIVMLTARAEEIDRVVGLELGADDYVAKPFSPKELVGRGRGGRGRGGAGGPGAGGGGGGGGGAAPRAAAPPPRGGGRRTSGGADPEGVRPAPGPP